MSHLFGNDDDTGTIFRDVIFLLMFTFVVLFLIAVMHINPDANKKPEETSPPGNVVVNVFWENGKNIDVDLWVMGPKDRTPVGYSNRAGKTFNLLRDDLGTYNDETGLNYENAYSRGIPDGEYIINVHMFQNKELKKVWPVEVYVEVSIMAPENSKNAKTVVYSGKVKLERQNDEVTVVRFNIKNKQLVKGSINQIQKKLRTSGPNQGQYTTPWAY